MNLQAWLESLGCTNVRPVTVTIDGTDYPACVYDDVKTGAIQRYYCVGRLPLCKWPARLKHPKDGVCFRMNDDDYYIACYMNAERITEQYRAYHPFGENFIVMKWCAPEPIDRYEPKPYKRYAMSVRD